MIGGTEAACKNKDPGWATPGGKTIQPGTATKK